MAKNQFTGEILHFHVVRMRVKGSGNLKQTFRSLDDINNQSIPDVIMSTTTNREPTTLANFKDQRGLLELKTTELGEYFYISKIVIFVKPIATGYPQ